MAEPNLHKVTNDTPYYRNSDGGYIDDLNAGAIVDKTDWVANGKVFVKFGIWSQFIWAPNSKTGWVNPLVLEPFVPVEPDPDPTIHITHTIEVYSDGSIRVDGNVIS